MDSNAKPTVYQTDLAKLPHALAPLIDRPQWAIWRWTQQDNGRWQKPPFMATEPERHASTKDPRTWADHGAALAAVKAGHGDGITYVLTEVIPLRRSISIIAAIPTLAASMCGRRIFWTLAGTVIRK
jgi:hypothetical protein